MAITPAADQPHHGRAAALNRMKRAGLAKRLIIVCPANSLPAGRKCALSRETHNISYAYPCQSVVSRELAAEFGAACASRRILPRYSSILMQRWQRTAHSSAG